jgi:hypothetical protein
VLKWKIGEVRAAAIARDIRTKTATPAPHATAAFGNIGPQDR